MIRHTLVASISIAWVLSAGCNAPGHVSYPDGAGAPLYSGLGKHRRAVTTASPLAQRYFDQGLVWTFAFNHDEAIRSFGECTRIDPNAAMCWWGIALCNGPHINNPVMPPERSVAAWSALQKAIALQHDANPTERALIAALSKRYVSSPPTDRAPLDQAYASAMREVWRTHPRDTDIGVLYAEAMMDLRPWDLWMRDGKPQPGTEEILAVLDETRRLAPDHPGANHLYIHALEASPNPARAEEAANRLRNAVPAAGHLVHMPSHIDVVTGKWESAARQNVRAVAADREYYAISPQQEFYRVYMAHNHHMLMFASMMEGRGEASIRAAREMLAQVPEEFVTNQPALADLVAGAPLDALKRFGRWDDILREPSPPSILPYTNAVWRLNRGLAFAAKGQIQEAERERLAFKDAVNKVPEDTNLMINKARHVLRVGEHVLNGEIAFRQGNTDQAVAELRKAVELEDQLRYMEPPEWVLPVRHTLGAVLLSAGRYEEAEKAYREDLKEWPNNGWSLYGLAKCLRARGEMAEADDVEKQFKKAWSRADTTIASSCLCVPGT